MHDLLPPQYSGAPAIKKNASKPATSHYSIVVCRVPQARMHASTSKYFNYLVDKPLADDMVIDVERLEPCHPCFATATIHKVSNLQFRLCRLETCKPTL